MSRTPQQLESESSEPKSVFRSRAFFTYLLILLVICGGLGGSWFFYQQMENLEYKKIETDFNKQANDLIRVTENSFKKNLEALKAVTTFLSVTPHLDRKSFRAFVDYLVTSNPDIYALEWIPKVDALERPKYELMAKQEGMENFSFFETDGKGKRREVEARSEYYPVFFAEPQRGNASVLGLDYSVEPQIKTALEKTVSSGRKTSTPVMPLYRFKEAKLKDINGFIIFSPVERSPEQSPESAESNPKLAGLAAMTFHVHSMVSYALKQQNTTGIRLQLEVINDQKKRIAFSYENSSLPNSLIANPLMQRVFQRTLTLDIFPDSQTFLIEKKIEMGGRIWTVVCTPAKDFFTTKNQWESKVTLAFGVLLTLLAAAYLFMLEQKRVQEMTLQLSMTDELTKVYNRRGFMLLAEKHLKSARWHKKRMLFVAVDLDYLKKINDTYGHAEGDVAIAAAAKMLRDIFRSSDIVGRMGGDEFAALLLDVKKLTAETVIENLRKQMTVFNFNSGLPYKVRMSVGTAYFDPANPCSYQELTNRADQDLYRHKQSRAVWPA